MTLCIKATGYFFLVLHTYQHCLNITLFNLKIFSLIRENWVRIISMLKLLTSDSRNKNIDKYFVLFQNSFHSFTITGTEHHERKLKITAAILRLIKKPKLSQGHNSNLYKPSGLRFNCFCFLLFTFIKFQSHCSVFLFSLYRNIAY